MAESRKVAAEEKPLVGGRGEPPTSTAALPESIFNSVHKGDFGMLRFGWLAFAVALAAPSAVFAADTMAPSEIQATFFTGQAFTARTPSGTKYKMTFTPDGKMTREPLAQSGNARTGTGTWKLSAKGFCTTWAHSKPTCFTIVPSGENKWSVQRIATTIATTVSVWSK